MALFSRLVSSLFLSLVLAQSATADPISDLLEALGIQSLLRDAPIVGTIGASVLDPNGTGDNDFLGADALNPENDLGLTLLSGELLGFGNKTGSDTALPLDFLGLGDLLGALGLTYEAGFAGQLRGLLAQDGMITSALVGTLGDVSSLLSTDLLGLEGFALPNGGVGLPGLNDQPLGLAILGAANSGNASSDGLLGLSLLTPGSSGNGGLIGVSVLSGDNSGNGSAIGLAILSGSNSGNGDNIGASVLGGDNAGNGGDLGVGVLNGNNSGNGGTIGGVAVLNGDNSGNGDLVGVGVLNGANSGNGDSIAAGVLNGDNSGNGSVAAAVLNGNNSGNSETISLAGLNGSSSGNSDFATVAAINGDNSGNSGTLSVAAINGADSGNSDFASVGALNGSNSGAGGVITVAALNEANGNGGDDAANSCATTGGVGCDDHEPLATMETCKDGDGDGICDEDDECKDTPAGAPVFLTGCHLTEDAPLVLRGVNFEFDKADLTPESIPILEHAVKVLNAQPSALVAVDGHTDAKGSFEYNDKLSYRRAGTVYDYLIAAGIKSERLVFRGFGENVPVAPNENSDGSDNPEGRAENRRVELNILKADDFMDVKEVNEAGR
ncbi:OmpA family [Spongiibacter sp. IMCC21906]|uniref:OmpA family protein n=1 Tax=Spongiibacter sp. IMCC21906 TaxID=1620392 RepID=UPI00062DDCF0|nr:OmpA family protein [Spongiibacter sp. IMCC21906]AKH69923.1 OmpA family [Spongiibacter sp. IMCC21906]